VLAILLERKPRETLLKTAFPRDLLTNLAVSSGCEDIAVATDAHSGSLVPRVISLKLPFRFRPSPLVSSMMAPVFLLAKDG